MKKEEEIQFITILNNLLKETYRYGWEVGRSWDHTWAAEHCSCNGHLKHDKEIETNLTRRVEEAMKFLGMSTEGLVVYTKEDCSVIENDWDYIAPLIEKN